MLEKFDSIYLDFDGTITKKDTVGNFLSSYASEGWQVIEKDWFEGRINSKVCMKLQLDLIQNLTHKEFMRYLNSIEVQDGFLEFCEFAEENGKKITILSDGFDVFIDFILKREGLNIPYFSNKLLMKEENGFLKFDLEFPYQDDACPLSLGMCKCSKVKKGEKFLYTGDGLSDRCIAGKSNLLFAKNNLKKLCEKDKDNIKFIEFNDFFDILNCIKEGREANAGFRN